MRRAVVNADGTFDYKPLDDLTLAQMRQDEIDNAKGTPEKVIAERTRRLAMGFDYDFGDERGVHRIGTTPDDLVGWDEVTKITQAHMLLGNGGATVQIVTDTGPVTVTAAEWQRILVASAAFRQPLWAASFALQQQAVIPTDFATDEKWKA